MNFTHNYSKSQSNAIFRTVVPLTLHRLDRSPCHGTPAASDFRFFPLGCHVPEGRGPAENKTYVMSGLSYILNIDSQALCFKATMDFVARDE